MVSDLYLMQLPSSLLSVYMYWLLSTNFKPFTLARRPVPLCSRSWPQTYMSAPTSTKQRALLITEPIHLFYSVQSLSRVRLFLTSWAAACQASLSITNSGACSDSCPLSWWCHPTISSSVVPFSCLQPFPASGSFLRSQFFASGGQNIGVSASALVLPMNIQDWFPLGLTGWISLLLKGLSRVFSSPTVQKHHIS